MKPKTLINTKNVATPTVVATTANKEKIKVKSKHELFITSQEVAELLGITYLTFINWVRAGKFEGVRMLPRSKGTAYKFIKSDFEEWLNKSMV